MLLQPVVGALGWKGVGHTEVAVGFWKLLLSGEKCDARLQERCGWSLDAVCCFYSMVSGMPDGDESNEGGKGERRGCASPCPAPKCYQQGSIV